jgi:hypothetical protein
MTFLPWWGKKEKVGHLVKTGEDHWNNNAIEWFRSSRVCWRLVQHEHEHDDGCFFVFNFDSFFVWARVLVTVETQMAECQLLGHATALRLLDCPSSLLGVLGTTTLRFIILSSPFLFLIIWRVTIQCNSNIQFFLILPHR